MQLFTFWRSLATFRVRMALNVKGIVTDNVNVNLVRGEQRADAYRAINPQMVVPALIDGDGLPLVQSLAILEYLDEIHPDPPLLPQGARAKARVRGLAQMVACDAHPLVVPRVRSYLHSAFGLDEDKQMQWARHWVAQGLGALEGHLSRDPATRRYCHGDALTIADLCLVSHAVGAQFFKCEMAPFPTVSRIAQTCLALDPIARAHPLRQPGAPASV